MLAVLPSPSLLAAAPYIDGYRITARIGSGGGATVYDAIRVIDDQPFAIKVIPTAAHPEVIARFELEARIGIRLEHPDIVAVHDFGQTNDVVWIAMERLHGRDLADAILDASLSFEDRLVILVRVARALHAAHEAEVLHRDVKPSNVFLTEDGGVRLLDFGISKVAGFNLTKTDMTSGTPRYMAPEQIVGSKLDGRADQFSLAVVAFEAFTGTFPWESDTPYSTMMATCLYPSASLSDRMQATDWFRCSPSIVHNLHRTIHRALESEPERRFESMEAFAVALEQLLEAHAASSDLPPVDVDVGRRDWSERRFDWARARAERLIDETSDLPETPRPTTSSGAEDNRAIWTWTALVAMFGILTITGLLALLAVG